MKYLIVGLGNIGSEYAETRHNIGFKVADYIAQSQNLTFETDRYAHSCSFKLKGRTVIIIKPTTYMNLSGKAVSYHMKKNNIPIENILIVSDDKDLPLGSIKLKSQGSGGTHNGLNHIIEILDSSSFSRLRFGIGDNFSQGHQVEYVLGHFSSQELELIQPSIITSEEIIKSFVLQGVQRTMNLFNTKKIQEK